MEAEKLSLPMYEKLYAIQQTAIKTHVVLFFAILFFMMTKNFQPFKNNTFCKISLYHLYIYFTIDILDKLTEILYMIRIKNMKYKREIAKFSICARPAAFYPHIFRPRILRKIKN